MRQRVLSPELTASTVTGMQCVAWGAKLCFKKVHKGYSAADASLVSLLRTIGSAWWTTWCHTTCIT